MPRLSKGAAPSRRRVVITALALLVLSSGAWTTLRRPSQARDWIAEQQRLPSIQIDQNRVTIGGVRNFTYDASDPAFSTRNRLY